MILLSILIPTVFSRDSLRGILETELLGQFLRCGSENKCEIRTFCDDGAISTGTKRNSLLNIANGKYVVFFDDDDWPEPDYVRLIMEAIEQDPDVIGFNGYMTTDGKNRTPWKISKDLPYKTVSGGPRAAMYLRFNNHLSPIKKEIALAIKFPDKYHGEDYDYAVRLKDSGLIKTEVYIDKELYHYRYITKK